MLLLFVDIYIFIYLFYSLIQVGYLSNTVSYFFCFIDSFLQSFVEILSSSIIF